MGIDRTFLRQFGAEAQEALEKVASKHGVSVSYKGARFSSANATIKFEIATVGRGGEVNTREVESFKRSARRYGFEPEDLGSEFTVRGETFKIVGLNTRAHKYPIVGERVTDGRRFKFHASTVKVAGRPRVSGSLATGLTAEIKAAFVDLACQLSPENLTCDGELSTSEVNRRRARLNREWAELERRAGQKVSEADTFAWDDGAGWRP